MNSVKNNTRLAEKRYRDKLNKDKKEIRLSTNEHKKPKKNVKKVEEVYKE